MIKCITPADKKYKSSEQVLFDDFCWKKERKKRWRNCFWGI